VYTSPVPKHRRATPSRCEVLARRLERVVDRFRREGIRVSDSSRLVAEVRLLRAVARQRSFPSSVQGKREVANAIRDVCDFDLIRKMAGAAQVSELARDLQDAAKGTAGRLEEERKPYQFQSQLWIGSVFAAGRLRPRIVPPTTGRTPDFLLCLPGRDYGLEVKRPSSSKSPRRLVEDGAQQLAARGLRGGVAVDCSDCLSRESLFRGSEDRRQPPYVVIDREFEELYRRAGSTVFDWSRREHLAGFAHVNFVIVFAQGWRLNGPTRTGAVH
jgi:hypothetical protein